MSEAIHRPEFEANDDEIKRELSLVTQPESSEDPAANEEAPRAQRVGRKAVAASRERSIEGRDATGLYLEEIARTKLLDAEKEVELSKAIEAGLLAEHVQNARAAEDMPAYLDQLEDEIHQPKENQTNAAHRKIMDNSKDIKTVVARLAKDEDLTDEELEWLVEEGRKALDQFTTANLRLVVSIARKYRRVQMPMLDLVQEGNTGLIRAVEKFDFTKGYKFSTYATWWVRQAVTRGIAQQARAVRLPVHVVEELNTLGSTERALYQLLGRDPEPDELAAELEIDIERVHDLLKWRKEHVSLDAPVDGDGEASLGDLLPEQTTPGPESEVLDVDSRAQLERLISQLDDRSAYIVRARFGMIDGTYHQLADIGANYDLTAERARQLLVKAVQRLQDIATLEEDGAIKVNPSVPLRRAGQKPRINYKEAIEKGRDVLSDKHLASLFALYENGTLDNAAAELGVSTSTLASHIAQIKKQLGL